MAGLERTVLYDLHVDLGAKLVPFAGYDMPVQYPMGVMKEHLHTRAAAGLFDVSHMGQILLTAKSGRVEDAALALERLVPVDVAGLKEGRQRYAMFTNDAGGILDDLMVANRGDHLFLVVNAACKAADFAHLKAGLPDCDVGMVAERALLALQGPKAEAALMRLVPDVVDLALHGCGDPPAGTRPSCGFHARAIPARTGSRFRFPTALPEPSRAGCWPWRKLRRSGLAPATACGWRPACAFTAMTSTRPRARSRPA